LAKLDSNEYASESHAILKTLTAGVRRLRVDAYEENGYGYY
jgi:hypothetical protein